MLGSAVAYAVFLIAVQFGVLAMGFVGIVLTGSLAFWAGAGAASTVDARRPKRDTMIIALLIGALLAAFLLSTQTLPGSRGGPNL